MKTRLLCKSNGSSTHLDNFQWTSGHRFLYLKPSLNMARLFSNMGALTQGPWAYLRDPSKHFIPYSQQCHTNIRRRCLHGKCNCCFHKQWMLGDGCSVISLRASGSNGNFQKWRIETSSWVSTHLIFVNVVGGKFQTNAKMLPFALLGVNLWTFERKM